MSDTLQLTLDDFMASVKACSGCSMEKPLCEFYFVAGRGWTGRCRSCIKTYQKRLYVTRKEKVAAYGKAKRAANPERSRAQSRAWHLAHKEWVRAYGKMRRERDRSALLDAHRRRQFGLEPDHFQALIVTQHSACAICRQQFSKTPNVDHDRVTGQVRGLLCSNCNTGIGLLGDDPMRIQAAVEYLSRFRSELLS